MKPRNRFQSRKVFVLHGLLLVAVVVVAYFSGRAQYEALRDQQIEETRIEQESSARASAQLVEQSIRVLAAILPSLGDDPKSLELVPKELVHSIGLVDRTTRRVVALTESQSTAVESAIASQPDLLTTSKPALRLITTPQQSTVIVAAPTREPSQVRVALLSGEQIAEAIASSQSRAAGVSAYIGSDEGGLIGGVGAMGGIRRLEEVLGSEEAIRGLRTLIQAGTVGTQVIDLQPPRGLSLVTMHSLAPLPGVRWFVLVIRVRQEEQISEALNPLLWQVISGATLMVAAVAIVLLSTTVSLRQGRRRIERLRTEMLNRDLQKARRIQLNWLPVQHGETTAVEIAAENQPAAHISGDLYNWFELPSTEDDSRRRTVVVIGDVSGHGLSAAFLMATTQLIVSNAMPRIRDPGACLTELNRQLCSLVFGGQFVTIMILVIDHTGGSIEIASAGQAPPLHKREGHVTETPIDPQLVAGVDSSLEYQTHRIDIRCGDSLLLYTDGVIEMMNEDDEQFGLPRLKSAFMAAPGDPTQSIHSILGAIAAHRQGDDAADDLTLVSLILRHS